MHAKRIPNFFARRHGLVCLSCLVCSASLHRPQPLRQTLLWTSPRKSTSSQSVHRKQTLRSQRSVTTYMPQSTLVSPLFQHTTISPPSSSENVQARKVVCDRFYSTSRILRVSIEPYKPSFRMNGDSIFSSFTLMHQQVMSSALPAYPPSS
jgi:hypothetical protein